MARLNENKYPLSKIYSLLTERTAEKYIAPSISWRPVSLSVFYLIKTQLVFKPLIVVTGFSLLTNLAIFFSASRFFSACFLTSVGNFS
jgi:hypothetical protein